MGSTVYAYRWGFFSSVRRLVSCPPCPHQDKNPRCWIFIFLSTPALIHTARPDGYVDYFSKPWLEYLGVTLVEVTGSN